MIWKIFQKTARNGIDNDFSYQKAKQKKKSTNGFALYDSCRVKTSVLFSNVLLLSSLYGSLYCKYDFHYYSFQFLEFCCFLFCVLHNTVESLRFVFDPCDSFISLRILNIPVQKIFMLQCNIYFFKIISISLIFSATFFVG